MDQESFTVGGMSQEGATVRFAPTLDRLSQLDTVQRLRHWCRSYLPLSAGSTVIDVGCGTGDELLELAQLVQPGGRAVGVDPNEPMLAVARDRLKGQRGVELLVGEAAKLVGVESGSADAVVCERVIQHVTHEPVDAFVEFARVLAPAGVLAVTDTDWSSLTVTIDDDPEGTAFLDDLRRRVPLPFTRNQLAGLKLAEYCDRAGLHVEHSTRGALSGFPSSMVVGVRAGLRALAKESNVSRAEITRADQVLTRALESDSAAIAVDLHAVVARK